MAQRFQLCPCAETAVLNIDAYLHLHGVVQTIFVYGPPLHVLDWKRPATALAKAFTHYKVIGLMSGLGTYCVDWLIRTLLVSFMRHRGVCRLRIDNDTKLMQLNGPDAKCKNIYMINDITGQIHVKDAFELVSYTGPPELFTMWLCLLGPVVAGRGRDRKRWRRNLTHQRAIYDVEQETWIV